MLVVCSICSVQVGAAIARSMFPVVGATGTLMLRLAFSALIMVALVRPRPSTWGPGAWKAVLPYGLTLGMMNLVFYLSLRETPLGVAVTVEFTGPLLLALVQTRKLRDLLWAALAMAGVALLGLDSTAGTTPRGLFLAWLAGLLWAAYIVLSSRTGRVVPGMQGLSMALLIAAGIAVIVGIPALPTLAANPRLIGLGVLVALLSSIVCYGLELVALRRMPTRVFGILMALEPAVAALAGLVVLHERLGLLQWLALAMVSIASVGVTLGSAKPQPPID